jgi:hypothetical protein
MKLRTVSKLRLLPALPLEGRVATPGPEGPGKAGVGVVPWSTEGPPPSVPPLKGEGGDRPMAFPDALSAPGELGA